MENKIFHLLKLYQDEEGGEFISVLQLSEQLVLALLTPEDNRPLIQRKAQSRVDIYLFGRDNGTLCILILLFITVSSFSFWSSCNKSVCWAQLFEQHGSRYYQCQEETYKSTFITKTPPQFLKQVFVWQLAGIPRPSQACLWHTHLSSVSVCPPDMGMSWIPISTQSPKALPHQQQLLHQVLTTNPPLLIPAAVSAEGQLRTSQSSSQTTSVFSPAQ